MGIIALIVIGAAAGWFAARIMKVDMSLPQTMLLGIAGALVGGLALRLLSGLLGALAGFAGAVLGAVLLLWAWKTFVKRR